MKKLVVFVFFLSALVYAKGGEKKASPTNEQGTPSWTHICINNISSWFYNNGSSDLNQKGSSGLIFPKGSGKTAVFQSGLVWGAKIDGTVEVGGSTYWQGTIPGYIKSDGTAANPSDPAVRIYRVRRDYKNTNADFNSEISLGEGDRNTIYAQYDKDWIEWPATQGAPYEDVNHDGKYEPSIDIPGYPGADQTIWFVCNDLDAAQVNKMYGSVPLGIEEQVTIWAYNQSGALGNMFFRKYLIINKNINQKSFNEMYVSMWTDVDLGDAGNDLIGCDTTRSLMFFYNGKDEDAVYSPLPPPAIGFDFFQGPKVPTGNSNDRAIFRGRYVRGFKNLPMTSFYYFINGDPIYQDPNQGNYNTGTLFFWNLLNGLISSNGQPFKDPNTGAITKFPLSGDPVTQTGWVDGKVNPPFDRRGGMVSGPFQMAYGDTQEVVVNEICAGATPGVSRLDAVTLLKSYDTDAQTFYNNLPVSVKDEYTIPSEYKLAQNYPNPFNPTTTIRYSIPSVGRNEISTYKVALKVYDVLGREIITLVNEEKAPGEYEVKFDGSKLASGVYFYRLQAGSFSEAKKLVLMK